MIEIWFAAFTVLHIIVTLTSNMHSMYIHSHMYCVYTLHFSECIISQKITVIVQEQ